MASVDIPDIPEPFASLPWCQPFINDPNFTRIDIGRSRHEDGDPFWRKTLTTPRAVSARCCFIRRPHPETYFTPAYPPVSTVASSTKSAASADVTQMESLDLIAVGPEVIGQQRICHGGFLATVMDEASGGVIIAYALDGGLDPYTVTLNMTYKKPIQAPGVIVARARIASVEGRKIRVVTDILDQAGDVCVRAESLFVRRKKENL